MSHNKGDRGRDQKTTKATVRRAIQSSDWGDGGTRQVQRIQSKTTLIRNVYCVLQGILQFQFLQMTRQWVCGGGRSTRMASFVDFFLCGFLRVPQFRGMA